ncbi:hypothetical protein GGTG_04269 [Gaeumannomyces tritici R3-111a-1]|uniref:Uncharacterized protein n=1 Tax=Gaeumannomyces tritici (strain R3-111a-1) TaxID=644352 RepID=J3NSL8_GAET3|nr:hypothetical protein GGTG_04269 [Gaeumannomyces tritici R3-111a-1]EJT79181.1 hypothetical protein GGTG_04269 [Gaeumannomyces tritici R3-111a-1]
MMSENGLLISPRALFHVGQDEVRKVKKTGRVRIITVGNSGAGFELCRILYDTGAVAYMAPCSKEKAEIGGKASPQPPPSSPSTRAARGQDGTVRVPSTTTTRSYTRTCRPA